MQNKLITLKYYIMLIAHVLTLLKKIQLTSVCTITLKYCIVLIARVLT